MKNYEYPDWLVPLEIAIKLKEIGFDKECIFTNSYLTENICFEIECNDDYYLSFSDLSLQKNTENNLATIPTWEQVFEWFREKGYHGVIAVGDESGEVNEYSYCINYLNELQCDFEQDSHLTYEEAREALVKALIQTYKNEQL